nr:MAG TPA: excisionase [Caudoviricetes sp.]
MTLEDIERMDAPTLTPAQVGAVLKADPQAIRVTAKQRPELLGFPVFCVGNRVKIPREPFLRYLRGE